MTARLQKWGNSQGIRIPKTILDLANFSDNEEINISVENEKIIISKAAQRKNILQLFESFDGEYTPSEVDFGKPVGKELWRSKAI